MVHRQERRREARSPYCQDKAGGAHEEQTAGARHRLFTTFSPPGLMSSLPRPSAGHLLSRGKALRPSGHPWPAVPHLPGQGHGPMTGHGGVAVLSSGVLRLAASGPGPGRCRCRCLAHAGSGDSTRLHQRCRPCQLSVRLRDGAPEPADLGRHQAAAPAAGMSCSVAGADCCLHRCRQQLCAGAGFQTQDAARPQGATLPWPTMEPQPAPCTRSSMLCAALPTQQLQRAWRCWRSRLWLPPCSS